MGYDYLALYVFMKRGSIKEVIGKFGVGKESGITNNCIIKYK